MPVRQTQSYLRSLFARRGIAPRHRMGQNFLIDLNIHKLIVEEASVGPDDVILEVGPGAGALTALMAGRGAMIVAVELDPEMAKLTQEAVAGFPSVRVLNTDALANKNTLSPIMIESVDEALASAPSRVFKLVANLPYNVATPVIMNLLIHPVLCPALMVVTIQREPAERMIALPASPAFGSLSVIIQALAEVSIVRVLPPSVFWPRPKVESTIVAIRPDAARRAALDVAWFHDMVRKLFLHRRKNLRHVLSGIWRDQWTKTEVEVWLESLGIDGQLRAEALGVDQFRTLAYALKKRLGHAIARPSDALHDAVDEDGDEAKGRQDDDAKD
ncbi:MAG: 16S rRNA (adenine(1518)-N(6)/adenine(1519)-N(6))-dimethyltransferase RsmA [Isosphaeraceae bacterium]